MSKGRRLAPKYKILIAGDAVAHTGFAHVTHSLANEFAKSHFVAVLGVNYYGDPHNYPYPIFPAAIGGDIYGIRRIAGIIDSVQPDIVLIINDSWIVKEYLAAIKDKKVIKMCYTPVDGTNLKRDFVEPLNQCNHVFAYNDFGMDELKKSGLTTSVSAIPHGVDKTHFKPIARQEARDRLGVPSDWFIVGCVNRNQPRKRLDLMVDYFAEFAKDKPTSVKLYYHGALQDQGYDLVQLCQYYDIEDRFMITGPGVSPAIGVPKDMLKFIYSSFDVQISTSNGEGHGMTTHEGMACGIPQIVPDWAALGDWAAEGVCLIPCTSIEVRSANLNTIGGIADKKLFIEALNKMYYDAKYRADMASKAKTVATDSKFEWKYVANHFMKHFEKFSQKNIGNV